MKQLVLFDIDGTLLRTQGLGRAATRAAMLEVFGACGAVDTLYFGGKTDRGILYELLKPEGIDEMTISARMDAYTAAISRAMQAIIADHDLRVLPGAHEAVTALRGRDDMLVGILTGNVAATAHIKLKAAGFDPAWFPVGAYGDEAADRNDLPPLALERAARHLGHHIPPRQATIIGDTPSDIACARAVGARAVAVATGFASRADLEASQPDWLLDDLTGLLAVLG
jgi:phosphoglycolate phosphatase